MLKESGKNRNQQLPEENSRVNGNIINIPIVKLRKHPDNTKYFHDIEGEEWDFFKGDIARNGILQPLLAAGDGDAGYTILSGHQRLRVARALQWHSVPCIIWNGDENHRDILFSTNLGRQLTLLERYRITMHLLDKMEDGRKENGRGRKPDFDLAQNGQNRKSPRDRVASMVPGVTKHDVETFRRIKELPQPVQQELFTFVEKENPSKKELKEKVNELNAQKRMLKAELRAERKVKLKKREMEQIQDYINAEIDPRECYEAKAFDAINRATNHACIEITRLVGEVFAHGPIRKSTALRLQPGIDALAQVLKEQRVLLLESWMNYRSQVNDSINALEEEFI